MTDQELLSALEGMRDTMIAVATGGPRIGDVNHEFQQQYEAVVVELANRQVDNPLPFADLWQWYGRWSTDLGSWASRRVFVTELFRPLFAQIRSGTRTQAEPTGWARVDRTMTEGRVMLARARTEEQFQAVGLLCREALISVAQQVFDPTRYPTDADVKVSTTDFKRMIEAYIAIELRGSAAEEAESMLEVRWIWHFDYSTCERQPFETRRSALRPQKRS